jgi:hypothetical protein
MLGLLETMLARQSCLAMTEPADSLGFVAHPLAVQPRMPTDRACDPNHIRCDWVASAARSGPRRSPGFQAGIKERN